MKETKKYDIINIEITPRGRILKNLTTKGINIMKTSLKFLIQAFITIAFFASGSILGSLLPEHIKIYAIVVASCLAILFFILLGFNGHKKEEVSDEAEADDE